MLFGAGTEPEAAALATILNLREALGSLEARSRKKYKDAQLAGFETEIQFSNAAAKALRRGPWFARVVRVGHVVRYWTLRTLGRLSARSKPCRFAILSIASSSFRTTSASCACAAAMSAVYRRGLERSSEF